jgi:hypothetical protein
VFDTGVVIRLTCPVERCAVLELPDDTDPAQMAAAMCDHLQRDGFYGRALIDRLGDVRIDGDRAHRGDLLRFIDLPLIAEERGGRRHAIPAGWISLDGRGTALCRDGLTVTLVRSRLDGGPLRATARKQPRTVQPDCVACRRRLQSAEAG